MFNLLPPEQKKKIRQYYLHRFAIVSLMGVCVMVGIFCFLMVPSFVVSAQKLKSATDRKNIIEQEIALADKEGFHAQLVEIKNDIDVLQKKTTSVVRLIEKIILYKNTGISLERFNYRVESAETKIYIEGIADDREQLQLFVTLLESQKFKEVYLPISNFAKDKDIPFNIAITIAHE